MRIPNPRLITGDARQTVLDEFQAIRQHGHLPESPDRNGNVSVLRRNLDLAVFMGLGITRGTATVLVERIYTSYARWRAAVEDVEEQMRHNRRVLHQRGGTRTETAEQRTAHKVWDEISSSTPLLLDGLTVTPAFEVVDPLIADADDGQDFLFNPTEHPTADGGSIDLKDARRVDLARTVRGLGLKGPFALPTDPAVAQQARDGIVQLTAVTHNEVERRAAGYVSADLVPDVVSSVMRRWTSRSIAAMRERLNAEKDTTILEPDLFQTDGLVPPP